jgi:hypothetical protein
MGKITLHKAVGRALSVEEAITTITFNKRAKYVLNPLHQTQRVDSDNTSQIYTTWYTTPRYSNIFLSQYSKTIAQNAINVHMF